MRWMHGIGRVGFCATLLWLAPVGAQTPVATAAVETLAKDLREEVVRTPVTVSDRYGRRETRNMAITLFRPEGEGPYPLVVFNHGRAAGAERAKQGRYRPLNAARYFVAKGFVVLALTRVGYGETYGDFDPDTVGRCDGMQVEPMALAVSDQVLAAVDYAKTLPYVDTHRWIVAGQSVGGLTAIATVGRAPAGLVAGINFSGGTGGSPETSPGKPCKPELLSDHWASLAGQARAPMLWIYWQNDRFWGPDIPLAWHKAWTEGGAPSEFVGFAAVGDDGHTGLNADMGHWLPVVDRFLNRLGFTQPAIVTRPPASSYATPSDVGEVPGNEKTRSAYQKFLALPLPRAFAVGGVGGWGYATGDYAVGKALGNCQHYNARCKLYVVDDDVVWDAR